jgi:fructose-specific phosphotransferase system IIC component
MAALPLLPRTVLVGALSAGIVGGVLGLIVGLKTYAPTAPFAVVELGLPATVTGAVIGLVTGSIISAARRIVAVRHIAGRRGP